MFARSVFQSVLERLKEEAETDEDDAATPAAAKAYAAAPRGLGAGFVVGEPPEAGHAAADMVRRAYGDFGAEDFDSDKGRERPSEALPMTDPPKPEPQPVMPPHLSRLSPGEIAEDLAIGERETLESLALRRRAFAALNHPDRHLPIFRTEATRRMTIANMLIDEAMRRLKRRSAQ